MTYEEGITIQPLLGRRLKTVGRDDYQPRRAGAVFKSSRRRLWILPCPPCVLSLSKRWWAVLKRRGYQVRRRQSTHASGAHGVLQHPCCLGCHWHGAVLLRAGRNFALATDDAAFPGENTTWSFDLAFPSSLQHPSRSDDLPFWVA